MIPKRFLDRFSTILLDMNSTFMFGEDRFGEQEDFFATYVKLGGKRLDRAAVNLAIRECYKGMSIDYEDMSKVDNFPSLAQGLMKYASVNKNDLAFLEAVFAHHELGRIPEEYANCLKRLSQTHRLGVVSNIWAPKDLWLNEFKRVGIGDLWHTINFSSDGRSIKPSRQFFRKAITACNVSLSEIVFVGDNLRVDIEPAKSYGLTTVWVTTLAETHPSADRIVPSLFSLEALPLYSEHSADAPPTMRWQT